MNFNVQKFAAAAATTAGVAYIVCGVVVAIAPGLAQQLFASLTHLVDVGEVRLTPGGFIVGLAEVVVYAYLVTGLFAWFYNRSLAAPAR